MVKNLFQEAKKENLKNLSIMQISTLGVNIDTLNDKLEKYETMITDKYTISAIYQNKKVKLYTEELNNSIIPLLKRQAEYLDLEIEPIKYPIEEVHDSSNFQLDDSNKIVTELLQLNKLKEKYKQLVEINSSYSETIITRTLFTEEKTLTDQKKEKELSFQILVKDKEKIATAYDTERNITNSKIDTIQICESTIKNALNKLYDKEIKDGTYNVILSSKVMGKILDKFIHLFSADSIQKGISLLIEKQNKEVFSKKITMIEDPTNSNFVGKRLFDDAGTKTYLKKVVEEGIFITPLYDWKSALVDKVTSTGNDYGEISVRNLYIEPGQRSLDELIESLEEGIYIDSVIGLHAGINTTNGNISLQSEGYYIENGKKEYAVKLFVLSTNIMDILNNVIELSNHIDFQLPTTASPDILVKNIKISK